MENENTCPKCGIAVEKEMAFCAKCGADLQKKCPGCKKKIRWHFEFCPKCGVDTEKQAKPENEPLQTKTWLKRHWWKIAASILLAGVASGVVLYLNSDTCAYKKAEKLYAEGDLEGAVAEFLALGDYRDSQERVPVIRYEMAETLYASGDLPSAASAFAALGLYSDSPERTLAIRYEMAEVLYTSGDLAGAALGFTELNTYNDSQDRSRAIRYELAESYYELGETEAADSLRYVLGGELFEAGNLEAAALGFEALGDYLDSQERSMAIRYEMAESLFTSGSLEEARSAFRALGSYSDSRNRARIVGWAILGFSKEGDVVTDSNTGLQWRVCAQDMTWDEATAWVNSLGGNWRMPNRAELRGLWNAGIREGNFGPFENSGWGVWSGEVIDFRTARYFDFYGGGPESWTLRGVCLGAFAVRSR